MKRSLIILILGFSLAITIPAVAIDDTGIPADEKAANQSTPASDSGGPYVFNPDTGLWENELYTWDPITKETMTKPIQPVIVPETPQSARGGTMSTGDLSSDPAVPLTIEEPEPSEQITSESNDSLNADIIITAELENTIDSATFTGETRVHHNTTAGNATSGTATAIASIFNLLRSSWSSGNALLSFVTNIFGDMVGDLVLDPDSLLQQGGSSADTREDNLDLNADFDARITNHINLSAASGDASVRENTTAGDATSGDAHVVANVVNMINSIIAAGESFVGVVNIHGNMDGDILLPPEVLDTILASNGPTESLEPTAIENGELLAEFVNNQAISNTITASAASGSATVAENTTAGDATSGDAETNLTVLNLTGREVIGDNALLVFVNVLGNWVGMIMDAPAGSTSAAIGGGISTNQLADSGTVHVDSDAEITNNLVLDAHSGNADVVLNTTAGNATTGSATASANILNIAGNQLSLADWFGILFINVFGSWNGSFGIDTPAGTLPTPPVPVETTGPNPIRGVEAFAVSQDSGGRFSVSPLDGETPPDLSDEESEISLDGGQVLSQHGATQEAPVHASSFNWLPIIGSVIGVGLLGTERLLRRQQP